MTSGAHSGSVRTPRDASDLHAHSSYTADVVKRCQHLTGFMIAAFLHILDDPNCLHVQSTGKTCSVI